MRPEHLLTAETGSRSGPCDSSALSLEHQQLLPCCKAGECAQAASCQADEPVWLPLQGTGRVLPAGSCSYRPRMHPDEWAGEPSTGQVLPAAGCRLRLQAPRAS